MAQRKRYAEDPTMGEFWLRDSGITSTNRPTRVPLSIYVLWHPKFVDGAVLAREIADWCGGGTTDLRAAGMAIPVHFRSTEWTAAQALTVDDEPPQSRVGRGPLAERKKAHDSYRRPINLAHAKHNIFVPLVDDHMIDDASWRRDLIDLAERHHKTRNKKPGANDTDAQVHLAPLQVSAAWPRVPEQVSKIKALHLHRWSDPVSELDAGRLERWRLRIRRLLTQALVRLLGQIRESALPTEVFLSHAKADRDLGPGVAERLRDIAAGYGQIDVFYDENDLPSGDNWRDRMLGSVRQGAGVVAVLSDAYATRYWCRREIQLARTPVRAAPPNDKIWSVRPSVVAVTMAERWSQLVGDLASIPAIRWKNDENHAASILDQLFRQALVAEFQYLYAQMLQERLRHLIAKPRASLPIAFITWTPDASTLLRLQKAARKDLAGKAMLVYPGHGFLPTEEEELDGSLGEDVEFVAFEKLADVLAGDHHRTWADVFDKTKAGPALPPMAERPLVALSAGDADDLASLGYDAPSDGSSQHVDVGVFRVCRAILQGGGRIAYGGVLRSSPNFAALLHDTIIALASSSKIASEQSHDPETPLESWVAASYAHRYPVERRAQLAGLCRFYFVGTAPPPDAGPQEQAEALARGLSEMRAHVAQRTQITFALAGKRWNYDGLMPGVAEEVLCAMEAAGDKMADPENVRVILVGEYGGIAREMIRYILRPKSSLPDALTFEGQLAHKGQKVELLMANRELRALASRRYAALARCLDALRSVASRDDTTLLPRLGLTVGQWKAIMSTGSIGFARRMLQEHVLPALMPRPDGASVPSKKGARTRRPRTTKRGHGRYRIRRKA